MFENRRAPAIFLAVIAVYTGRRRCSQLQFPARNITCSACNITSVRPEIFVIPISALPCIQSIVLQNVVEGNATQQQRGQGGLHDGSEAAPNQSTICSLPSSLQFVYISRCGDSMAPHTYLYHIRHAKPTNFKPTFFRARVNTSKGSSRWLKQTSGSLCSSSSPVVVVSFSDM